MDGQMLMLCTGSLAARCHHQNLDDQFGRIYGISQLSQNFIFFPMEVVTPQTTYFGCVQKFNPSTNQMCKLCGRNAEINIHLFFNCPVAIQLWRLVETKINLNFEYFQTWYLGLWLEEGSSLTQSSKSYLLSLISFCLWGLRELRNDMLLRSKLATITVV